MFVFDTNLTYSMLVVPKSCNSFPKYFNSEWIQIMNQKYNSQKMKVKCDYNSV